MAKSRVLVVCVAGFVLLGGLFVAGPYVALEQLSSAAAKGDAKALSELVDFDQVRTNTKVRLRSAIEQQVPAGIGGLGMVGAAVAGAAFDPLVDSVMTPETLAAWLKQAPSSAAATGAQPKDAKTEAHFRSISEFDASVNASGVTVEIVFTRQYLRWRVTDIRFDLSLDKVMSQLGMPSLPKLPNNLPDLKELVPSGK